MKNHKSTIINRQLYKILVIDDEEAVRGAIKISLKKESYELIFAENGKIGLEKYYEHRPVVIILDLRMPVMDGFEFLEKLQLSSTALCSVIVLTGHGNEEDMERCFRLGISTFLKKPFNAYELKGLIRHAILLGENSYLQGVTNTILQISMEDVPLDEQFRQILDVLFSIPWLTIESKGSVFVVEEKSDILVMKAQHGLPDEIKPMCEKVPFGKCICGLAASKGELVFVDSIDDRHENRYPGITPHGHYCVPILSAEKEILGVINLYVKERHKRDIREERFLFSVAGILSQIITSKKTTNGFTGDRTFPDDTPYPILDVDKDGNILHLNRAAETCLKRYNPTMNDIDTILPDGFKETVKTCRENNTPADTLPFAVGEEYLIWQLHPNQTNNNVRAYALNVTDRVIAEREALRLSHHDILTGLPNRTLFFDRLSQNMEQNKRNHQKLALLSLGLDRFKPINDSLGYDAGDKLLKEIAGRLKECVRKADTIARMGGDEFAVILTKISKEHDTILVAKKIITAINSPVRLKGLECSIGVSVGIAVYSSNGETPETLLANADRAMNISKKESKNHYQFYRPDMNEEVSERLRLENDLRRAVERKELILHYQPQMNTMKNELTGVEALVRWRHPLRGILSPIHFIPIAQETGLLASIDRWVLYSACTQNREWQDSGFPNMTVAVNLSGDFLKQRDFVDTVTDALEKSRLAPEHLELELTEDIVLHDIDSTISKLTKLKEMGIALSLDDFGTGYSSLRYLKKLPITRLKIDRSFVTDITTDADDAAIVKTIIAMANTLRLGVIAEGVETKEQLDFLNQSGCNEIQGYYFGKPTPSEEIMRFLQNKVKFETVHSIPRSEAG